METATCTQLDELLARHAADAALAAEATRRVARQLRSSAARQLEGAAGPPREEAARPQAAGHRLIRWADQLLQLADCEQLAAQTAGSTLDRRSRGPPLDRPGWPGSGWMSSGWQWTAEWPGWAAGRRPSVSGLHRAQPETTFRRQGRVMRTRTPSHPSSRLSAGGGVDQSAVEAEQTVGMLAAEAYTLVAHGCASQVGRRRLEQLAGGRPELLCAAARRCGDVGRLDRRVQEQAARLLRRTAGHHHSQAHSAGHR